MKKLIYLTLTALIISFSPSISQPSSPPETWFDFWVGTWDLVWKDANGTDGTGKNVIERQMNDKVIQENFEALTGAFSGFIGKSWSVYDVNRQGWYQTWVDNQGGYLDFHAEYDGDNRMFVRSFKGPNGNTIMQRMVFRDIKEDSFTWDWENSTDEGKTWNLNWQILYTRAK